MASNFTGMDIQAVQTLAKQLTAKSGEIQALGKQLTSQLDTTPWVGPDREQFVADWRSRHLTALTNVANSLKDAATRATKNAAEQTEASSR